MPRAARLGDRAAGVALSIAFMAFAVLGMVECAAVLLLSDGVIASDTPLILVFTIAAPATIRFFRFRRFPSLAENAVACAACLVVLFALAVQPARAFPGLEGDYSRMVFGIGGAMLTYCVILGYRFVLRRRS